MRRRGDFLVFGQPVLGAEELAEVQACLEARWIGTGPRVSAFEAAFSAYKGGRSAAAVSSCTAALHLSSIALGIRPGDEVITSANTFCATVNAIIHVGGTPVLADIEAETGNIDPSEIERRITPRTRAVIPVHFAGRPCNMDAIMDLANKYNLLVIEDCAHAIETEYDGKPAGSFGHAACFSFYATKNVTTAEGGMVLGPPDVTSRIKTLALHGLSADAWNRFSDAGYKHYLVQELGYKCNMTDIQAAIGIHQLRRIESNWQKRREIWGAYMNVLRHLPVRLPVPVRDRERHAFHLFTILIDPSESGGSRDALLEAMTQRNIGVGVHYLSIAEHPYYQRTFGWHPADYPNAMRYGRQTMSLPLSPALNLQDIHDVCAALEDALADPRNRA